MLTRRFFAGCAICAATGVFAAGEASAQGAPGFSRKILSQIDGPVPGYTTIAFRFEIDPGLVIARHTHPGIESSMVVEGGGELVVDGQPTRKMGPGEGFQVAAGVPHMLTNGPTKSIVAGTYIVEKDKPLASPA